MTKIIGGPMTATGGVVVDEDGIGRLVNRTLVNASLSGDTEAVAAQGAGIRIRVVALYAVASGAATTKFKSSSTDISPATAFAANGGMVLPRNDHGWFQTAPNEALNANLNGAIATGFMIDWIQAK